MSTLQIDLDERTGDALTTLARTRGVTPDELAAQIVADYVGATDLARAEPAREPDPLDALVGKYDIDPVDDIDEVIYGR